MCDCHIGIEYDVFLKTCKKKKNESVWVDLVGACVDKKRNEKKCRGCQFWCEEEKLKF